MIGSNISKLRKRKGMTLTELAERAGVAKSYLSNLERNLHQNPSINVIEKIAMVLGVEVKFLIKTDKSGSGEQQLEDEWLELINEMKVSGIDKEQIEEYRTLIKFIKWQKENSGKNE
ncbi:XRE family transcriptional regulator [Cytobacillus purgationiresistens]|uniref:XRE family transcriptional regulator of biofilm formation n=1 Tax=Cytobacillus purgationiresistens TaxID=863449 RepID=A0ABU0ALN0_9BACI|nr:XRE family transcriptional regulator [Cytobacillus purgationiresistens]MDQ0270935.1 XRE family transcriptional regulator of biofilm formation [Cytobacillus purgationiresistens]